MGGITGVTAAIKHVLAMVEKHISNGRARASTGNKRRKKRFFKLKWLLYLFVIGLILGLLAFWVFEQQTKNSETERKFTISMR